jgi:hypothetical protein
MRHRTDPRIEVRLPVLDGARRHRELRAFACFCIARIEREMGALDGWVITIAPAARGFAATVTARRNGSVVDRSGAGRDSTLAVWDALCNLEQALREELFAASQATI